jgi:hypothetical protein
LRSSKSFEAVSPLNEPMIADVELCSSLASIATFAFFFAFVNAMVKT